MRGTVIAKTTTEYIDGSTRGDEIELWRNENGTHDIPMLILEDCADVSPMEHLCVRSKPHTGLAMDDVPRAILILEDQISGL